MNITDFFRMFSGGNKPSGNYKRQVFLVTDDLVRNRCLDMIQKRDAFIEDLVAAAEGGVESLQEAFRNNAGVPPDESALNQMAGIAGWPHMLKSKEHDEIYSGMWVGEPGAEVVLHDRQVYITMPIPALIEKEYDEPEAHRLISEWQPPAWMEKVDPAILEENRPVGFPRNPYSGRTVNRFRAPS